MNRYRRALYVVIMLMTFLPLLFVQAKGPDPAPGGESTGNFQFTRIDETFTSQGDRLKAWLYLPKGISKPPVVVMAHGFGGQRSFRLPAYARHFARLGMAVFLFDYRGFADSEGEPRNYINPSRHLEDWDAAIDFVKKLDSVDGKRMGLWGTSFSGGHVIVEAAKHRDVKAVVSQVPFTDGIATQWYYMTTDPLFALKGLWHGLLDVFISLFTDERHLVRIAGRPDEGFAMMNRPDTMDGVMKLTGVSEEEFEKGNFCPGNIVFTLGMYRPIGYAEDVECPVLIIGAETDTLFPPTGPKKMADRMKQATYISMPINHFDPYVGEPFERLVREMGEFLKASL